jgi:L-seryl-tRNA(Ser) seleniumtransferase
MKKRPPGGERVGGGSKARRTVRQPASLLRELPQVEKLLRHPQVAALVERHSRPEVVKAVQACLAELRGLIRADGEAGEAPAAAGNGLSAIRERLRPESIANEVEARLDRRGQAAYRAAINATGIILHTGLGRAVYSLEAQSAVASAIRGYSLVEIDPSSGERNRREVHLTALLTELTGAESATVVNNNAGATLIILAALARGKEVILSRGQMVEIGGAFRIPDVMEESGARLIGVGTTNRTYVEDYRRAITAETGLLLQVHTSNYEITGFARHTPLEELVALGRQRGLLVVSDLGSGCLLDLSPFGLKREPLVSDSVQAGADLVCFSGDKLLGGPQAGIIVGKREPVEKVRRHPLFRALRVDKVALAGLEATLRLYRDPKSARQKIPALSMLTAPEREVRRRAGGWVRGLLAAGAGAAAEVVKTSAQTGSGSLPAQDLPSWAAAVEVKGYEAGELAQALRMGDPPIFTRIHEGRVLIDFRTVLRGEERALKEAILRLPAR